jgi:hypothetical protein
MPGRSAGMLFMTIFGTIWWFAGSGVLPRPFDIIEWVAGVIVAGVLLVSTRQQARGAESGPPPGVDGAQVQRRFNLVAATEGIAIFIVVFACIQTGHQHWIAPLVCLIVGIHFLPLARTFAVPAYNWTGGGLIAVALLTLVLAPGFNWPDSAWLGVPTLAAAIILWFTAALLPVVDGDQRAVRHTV